MVYKSFISKIPEKKFFNLGKLNNHTIGLLAPCYGLERVSYSLPLNEYDFVKLPRFPLHKFDFRSNYHEQTPFVLGPKCDLIHTFNRIPLNRSFVTSVELEFPRYFGRISKSQRERAFKSLLSDRCKAILPLSDATARYISKRFISNGYNELVQKIKVFNGGIHDLGKEKTDFYNKSRKLKLLFVGGAGLGKSLKPCIEALKIINKEYINAELTIIGNATESSYIVPGEIFETDFLSESEAKYDWLKHYSRLPNLEVRELMYDSDVFLFPSMDESLGWVPIEAGLSYVPTIATDIYAIPENVLDGTSGWLIKVEKDDDGRWKYLNKQNNIGQWEAVQQHITNKIVSYIEHIMNNPSIVEQYGIAARNHMLKKYSTNIAAEKLKSIYDNAI